MYLSVAMSVSRNEPDRFTPEQASEEVWSRFTEQPSIESAE